MTPLLLIPGMMCDARLFAPQIAAFSARRPLHLAVMDRHDSVPAIAAGILSSAPPRFALAGLSMGGIVAMEMLAQQPERIERIALLDTNPLAELPEVAARREPQIDRVRRGDLAAVMRDELKPNYIAEGPLKPAILDICMAMALALGPEVFVRQSRALQTRADRQDVLRAFRGPALVLCGAQDRLCPPDRHRLMHGLIAESVLEIIESAGHMPTLETPKETNAALRRWLEA